MDKPRIRIGTFHRFCSDVWSPARVFCGLLFPITMTAAAAAIATVLFDKMVVNPIEHDMQ